MEISTNDVVKEELMKTNPAFRDLVNRHQNYEQRLTELSGLSYPSTDEQLEESNLKKKKLQLKDEIYAMMSRHSISH